MNPASGPDYLRMEKYNPKPRTSPLVGIWRRAEYPNLVKRPKLYFPEHSRRGVVRLGCFGNIAITEKELIETEIMRSMMETRIVAPPITKYWATEGVNAKKAIPPTEKVKVRDCQVCGISHPLTANARGGNKIQRHHIKPRSEHPRLRTEGIRGLCKCVWLCQPCHTAVHLRFTNAELAACPWEETRFLMRNSTAPAECA